MRRTEVRKVAIPPLENTEHRTTTRRGVAPTPMDPKMNLIALLLLINAVRGNLALPLELVGGVCHMDCNSAKQVTAQWADTNEWGTMPAPIRVAMLELGWGPLQWRNCSECYHGYWNQSSHGPSLAECVVREYTGVAHNPHCPLSQIKLFSELSAAEKAAAESLGYTEMIWDSNSPYSCCFDGYLKRGNPSGLQARASSTSARAARIIGPALLAFCMLLGLLIGIVWIMRKRSKSREANSEFQGVTVMAAAHSAALPSVREEDEQAESDPLHHHACVTGGLTKTSNSSGSSNYDINLDLDNQLGQDVEVLAYIGQGEVSKVFKGSWKGITVAVKVCNLMPNQVDDGTVTKGSPFIHMEAAMAAKLRHPNVVRLHDCKIDRPNAGKSPNLSPKGTTDSNMRWKARIIMEYCENGSLRSALQQGLLEGQEGRPVQPELGAALALSYDMACGMVYLHTLQIVHGDLKAENVLLSPRQNCPGGSKSAAKIADFGLANGNLHVKQGVGSHLSGVISGPLHHIAPECLHLGHVSKAADVYAFGILMYELMTAKRAWEGMSSEEILEAVRDKKQYLVFPQSTPPDLLQIAISCLSPEPMERPSMEDVKASILSLCLSCGIWPQSNDSDSVDLGSRSASITSSNGSMHWPSWSEAAPSSEHDPACFEDSENSDVEAAIAAIRNEIELSSSEGHSHPPITRRESSVASLPGIDSDHDDWQDFFLAAESPRAAYSFTEGGEIGSAPSRIRRQRAPPARSFSWHDFGSPGPSSSKLPPLIELPTPNHGQNRNILAGTSWTALHTADAGRHYRPRPPKPPPAKRNSSWSAKSSRSELPTIMDKLEARFDTVPET